MERGILRAGAFGQHCGFSKQEEGLIPLAERCGRVMREALAALETLRARPVPGGRAI